MTERSDKIENLLTNREVNVSMATVDELVDAFWEFDDALLVEAFRAAWVCLAFRYAGADESKTDLSFEGKEYFMQLIHDIAGKSL